MEFLTDESGFMHRYNTLLLKSAHLIDGGREKYSIGYADVPSWSSSMWLQIAIVDAINKSPKAVKDLWEKIRDFKSNQSKEAMTSLIKSIQDAYGKWDPLVATIETYRTAADADQGDPESSKSPTTSLAELKAKILEDSSTVTVDDIDYIEDKKPYKFYYGMLIGYNKQVFWFNNSVVQKLLEVLNATENDDLWRSLEGEEEDAEGESFIAVDTASPAAGADVDTMDSNGNMDLYQAAASENLAVVENLVEQSLNGYEYVNLKDENEKTALHYAATTGNLDVVEYLVDKGARVDELDNDGKTPLMYAAASGNLKVVKYLVGRYVNVDAMDNDRKTPLMHAATSGNLEVVKYLVDEDAKVNAMDNDGKTALFHAAASGKLEVVRYLVDKGLKGKKKTQKKEETEEQRRQEKKTKNY